MPLTRSLSRLQSWDSVVANWGDLSELELCSSDDIQFQVVAESELDDVDYDDDDDEEMSESHSGLDEDEGNF